MKSRHLTCIGPILGLYAVMLAPMAVVVAETETGGPGPMIEVREMHKDGGVVLEGTVIGFQFEVANRGQGDLELKQVKPSCGCTVTQWDRVIRPGASGIIEAQMRTEYFRGSVTKSLTVFSNDPDRPQMELTITTHLIPLVKISPGPDALLTVGDRPVSQEFTLERNGGRPMKIIQVIPNAPYLKADISPLPGQGRYKLRPGPL